MKWLWIEIDKQHEFNVGIWNATVYRRTVLHGFNWHVGLWTPDGYVSFKAGSQRSVEKAKEQAIKALTKEVNILRKALSATAPHPKED